MKNVSEMNNGSLYSIIFCFLNIVPPLAFPLKKFSLSCLEVVLEGGDMKKNYLFTVVIVYLFFIVLKLTGAYKYVEYESEYRIWERHCDWVLWITCV